MKKLLLVMFLLTVFSGFWVVHAHAAEWTFMVYLDGDNNLEDASVDDFLEMASVGSDENINIIVQFDRIPGYAISYGNWTNCQRFRVTNGMRPTVLNAVSDWGDGRGGREVNMGDPRTLTDFVTWGMANYPANRYALILWNHGDGWRDVPDARLPLKAVCWDDTSGWDEALETKEIKQALMDSGWVDVIGFDACLMGMAEVAYEMKDVAGIMTGSEETEPGTGWPYHTLLADLKASPTLSPSALGEAIVLRYGESYNPTDRATQSAIDLSLMDTLADSIRSLADAIMGSDKSDVFRARGTTQNYDEAEYIDLHHFADLLVAESADPVVQTAAGSVMAAVEDAVIANDCDISRPDSHGLSIYFPERQSAFDADYNASVIDFPNATRWDEVLEWYYTTQSITIDLFYPDSGAVLPAGSPSAFSWEAGPGYRYQIQFSPTGEFDDGSPTLSMPNNRLMLQTDTDDLPAAVWARWWEIIKRIERNNGIVYWRVKGKDSPSSLMQYSETRSFTIE